MNRNAVICYVLGILVQLPFLSTAFYTGPIATALGGVDISWIVGLAVICPLYYALMKWAPSKPPVLAVHESASTPLAPSIGTAGAE